MEQKYTNGFKDLPERRITFVEFEPVRENGEALQSREKYPDWVETDSDKERYLKRQQKKKARTNNYLAPEAYDNHDVSFLDLGSGGKTPSQN
ncbi:hypothetical protein DPSP01_014249 [Paraphaeosphaeria sporulosa]